MRRALVAAWVVSCVLAACSSDTGGSGEADVGDAPAVDASATDAPSDARHDATTDGGGEVGALDSGVDAQEDAIAEVGADAEADAHVDAAADAELEAGTDAGDDATEGGALDAGDDGGDAGADASDAAACYATRCLPDYRLERCINGAWVWEVGPQDCCRTTGRFVIGGGQGSAATVYDSQTGLTWARYGARVSSCNPGGHCAAEPIPSRAPTHAELQTLIIGPTINNKPVCSPTIDQDAFPWERPDVHGTSDTSGVDFGTGRDAPPAASCSTVLCIRL
jgi:hypothetical protein